MIKVIFTHFTDGTPQGFSIKGHSGLAAHGSDILCSAVSSAAYMTANTITEVMQVNAHIEVDEKGEMILSVLEEDAVKTKDLLSGFILHITELSRQYPKNITITTSEV